MLIPVAPIIRQSPPNHVANTDMDIDANADADGFESQEVLDILDSVLDLIPISPRLDRLADLLGKCPFEGWALESQVKVNICSVPLATSSCSNTYDEI